MRPPFRTDPAVRPRYRANGREPTRHTTRLGSNVRGWAREPVRAHADGFGAVMFLDADAFGAAMFLDADAFGAVMFLDADAFGAVMFLDADAFGAASASGRRSSRSPSGCARASCSESRRRRRT